MVILKMRVKGEQIEISGSIQEVYETSLKFLDYREKHIKELSQKPREIGLVEEEIPAGFRRVIEEAARYRISRSSGYRTTIAKSTYNEIMEIIEQLEGPFAIEDIHNKIPRISQGHISIALWVALAKKKIGKERWGRRVNYYKIEKLKGLEEPKEEKNAEGAADKKEVNGPIKRPGELEKSKGEVAERLERALAEIEEEIPEPSPPVSGLPAYRILDDRSVKCGKKGFTVNFDTHCRSCVGRVSHDQHYVYCDIG